jgi:GNAT superfamily N-acetyltransferase
MRASLLDGTSMLTIRTAVAADTALIRELIAELAYFEREQEQVRTTEADILRDGFGDDPQFRAFIAEWRGEPAGFALFFDHYSTWRGRGFYLEDLFVRPDLRGRGIGKALLTQVAIAAAEEDRTFIRWSVLDWNERAVELYKTLGANFLEKWRSVLLSGDALKNLAEKRSYLTHPKNGVRRTKP